VSLHQLTHLYYRILDRRQAEGMTLPGLMEPFPVESERQQTAFPIRRFS
jgi:hypothetical protein